MDKPDEGVPYGTRLTELASERPDDAVVTTVAPDGTERTITLGQLEAGANQWGRELAERGATVGAYVALIVPNSIELVLAAYGCWKIGAVPIPVRWDLPEWERSRLVEAISPAVLIDEAICSAFAAAAARQPDSALPEVVTPMTSGICSSGSTGMPKVILDTQPALWTELKTQPFMAVWTPVPRPQRILVPAPMYHTNGFNTLFYILGGDRLVVLEKFDAELFLDVIEKHRITNFTATPTMLSRVARVPGVGERDLSSVVWMLQGAAVMPAALLETWFKLLNPEQILMAYGMTENFGLTVLRGDEWLEHRGSTGRGFRDTEIKILDADGNEVPTGELGEIYMRSPIRELYRYIGGAQPLPSTPDGFHTGGDIGRVDEDGYLYVTDRRVDMIVTGGANVFPAEVEAALAEHDDIVDVVVLGLKDPEWGRRVHAVVQLADPANPLTEQQVIDYAKSKLASYKAPKTVEFVAEIPRSAATKVSRSAMVEARGG
ncbi:class I adenylate-forming enzyme family protein [Mycolicibacterium moriokaense]|uniref:Acid-CoA ligase n=1 Tax=Mycolicibacterium moriokaense TaxID=39691 RepID=A0AAD1HH12_9MYCO|nr:AMP-binding protein [Mycolicibacterium moriokaense]BBX04901.1 putative acid-CoA ligase [Mycolicibacterium moriokaense]